MCWSWRAMHLIKIRDFLGELRGQISNSNWNGVAREFSGERIMMNGGQSGIKVYCKNNWKDSKEGLLQERLLVRVLSLSRVSWANALPHHGLQYAKYYSVLSRENMLPRSFEDSQLVRQFLGQFSTQDKLCRHRRNMTCSNAISMNDIEYDETFCNIIKFTAQTLRTSLQC